MSAALDPLGRDPRTPEQREASARYVIARAAAWWRALPDAERRGRRAREIAPGLRFSVEALGDALGVPRTTVGHALRDGGRLGFAAVAALAALPPAVPLAEATAAVLGWRPGDPCPCGCGALAVAPENPRALRPDYERRCPGPDGGDGCPRGEVTIYRAGHSRADHHARCRACAVVGARVVAPCIGVPHGTRQRREGRRVIACAPRCRGVVVLGLRAAERRARLTADADRRPWPAAFLRREPDGTWAARCFPCGALGRAWYERIERLRPYIVGEALPRSWAELRRAEAAIPALAAERERRRETFARGRERAIASAEPKGRTRWTPEGERRRRLADVLRPWTGERLPNVHVWRCERCDALALHDGPRPGDRRPRCGGEHRFHPACRREAEREAGVREREPLPRGRGRPGGDYARRLGWWATVAAWRLGLTIGASPEAVAERETAAGRPVTRQGVAAAVAEVSAALDAERLPDPWRERFGLVLAALGEAAERGAPI